MLDPLGGYAAAVGMGFLLGMLGGGGSILTVPILVYLCDVRVLLASSYSLWIVGATALVGGVGYARRKEVSYRTALTFGPPSVVGVVLARSWLLPSIPERFVVFGALEVTRDLVILAGFALLMIAAGVAMVCSGERRGGREGEAPVRRLTSTRGLMLAAEGLLVGVLTGLVGAGGGFLIVPVLVTLLGLPIRVAVGTSLAIICGKSLLGLIADPFFWSDVDFRFLLLFTAAAIVGVLFGNLSAHRVTPRPLKIGFGCFAMLAGVAILSKELLLKAS